ncbi:hypothetical protein AMJ57_00825 [Parcubacteria bacterium SG8_24]|nr:MAG: hypothetical protein AMJ57_00825 [Parcubacteria bacterium SG8_24]
MRLLVIGKPDVAENARFREEAAAASCEVRVEPVTSLVFEATTRGTVVLVGDDELTGFDALYLRSFHPYISEALTAAEYARKRGLVVVDRYLAEGNYVQSKLYDAWRLAEEGLNVPTGFQALNDTAVRRRLPGLSWPAVVKGVHGSQGRRVHRISDAAAAGRLARVAGPGFYTYQELLDIDEEYRILTVGHGPLGAMRKTAPPDGFRHNLSQGASGEAVRLPDDILRVAADASRILQREFAGIDLALVDGVPVIVEVNRSPGFIGFERVTGHNVARSFLDHVSRLVAQERHLTPG